MCRKRNGTECFQQNKHTFTVIDLGLRVRKLVCQETEVSGNWCVRKLVCQENGASGSWCVWEHGVSGN